MCNSIPAICHFGIHFHVAALHRPSASRDVTLMSLNVEILTVLELQLNTECYAFLSNTDDFEI